MKGRSVLWVETGQVFDSLREVANKFQLKYQTLFGKLNRSTSGSCNAAPGVTLQWEVYIPEEGEYFRAVPGYEGLYSISNKWNVYSETGKRLLKPVTNYNCEHVMLYKEGLPYFVAVKRLMSEAWPELVTSSTGLSKERKESGSRNKSISCTTEGIYFHSYRNCCKFYHFDYQEFRKAVRSSAEGRFSYKGKEFLIFT